MAVIQTVVLSAALLAGLPAGAASGRIEVWSPNPLVAVFEGPDYSGQDQPDCTVRIVGARNSIASGQVALFAKQPFAGPAAAASDLKLPDGSAVISARAIRIRYALPTGSDVYARLRFPGVRDLRRFEALVDAPRPEATTHLVWLTVNVPADAAPGDYTGALTVAGRRVAVRLMVCPFTVCSPIHFTTFVDCVQSPESVALQYEVPMWSEKHLELVGKSFDCLAGLGNKTIYLPLIAKTHFGNEGTMVRWILPTAGGSARPASRPAVSDAGAPYAYDYSVLERYLDLYIRRIGKPKVICLYAWEPFCGGSYFGSPGKSRPLPPAVSSLDPTTGEVGLVEGPIEGTPGSEAFWKPMLDGLRERLAKRGLGDEAIMIGLAGDVRPSREVVEMFKRAAPYARWLVHSHGRVEKLYDVPVGYLAHVWGVGDIPDPDKGDREGRRRFYGWKNPFLRCMFPREGGRGFPAQPPLWTNAPLAVYREIAEKSLTANLRGFGRIGADFWPVLPSTQRGRMEKARLPNRFPISNWSQLSVTTATASVLHPGTEGAVSTIRLEMMREGLQECEARIAIEKALDDPALKARLGHSAAVWQELLDQRVRFILKARTPPARTTQPTAEPAQTGWEWFAADSGWQDRTVQLFIAAGAAAMGAG